MPAADSLKRTLRRELRSARRSLSAADHRRRSHLAASSITRMASFKSGARVAVYLPFDGETNPASLLAAAARRRVRIFVPVIDSVRHGRLRFHPLSGKTQAGAFGISVPRSGRWVGPRWFDLIVVPSVGVDAHGRRLGMGGGFYDRALAFRRTRQHWLGPRLVGLAFGCQRVPSVFAQDHDVRLDALATEEGIAYFSRNPVGNAP
jgi:5-formyltetrahydrofolate cyclo-ligase